VARKIDPQLPFFPSSFAVELRDRATAHVHHEIGRFTVRLDETAERVHAVATPEGSSPALWKLGTLRLGANFASGQVRDMARCGIGSMLDLDPSEIEISSVAGAPVASSGGVDLPVDLSLSHHGRFVACAWLPAEGVARSGTGAGVGETGGVRIS
jgi:hypothetical protein